MQFGAASPPRSSVYCDNSHQDVFRPALGILYEDALGVEKLILHLVARAGMIAGEEIPGITPLVVVLPDGSKPAFIQVGNPLLIGGFLARKPR
jgi:hypothetical protein